MLLIAKFTVHKLLYLVSRVVDARSETVFHLLDSFLSYFLFIAGIFICLSQFGINTSTLSLTGGVLGVIFGLGCQNVVADILAGILMTFEGVARVGDLIMLNGRPLFILSVGVRTTRLTWFGEIMVMRNNDLKDYYVLPAGNKNRVTQKLKIDMRESLERVERILAEELPRITEVLNEVAGEPISGPIYNNVSTIGEGYIELYFLFYCQVSRCRHVSRAFNRELLLMCEKHGIRLAMPQVVVNQPADPAQREERPEQQGSDPST